MRPALQTTLRMILRTTRTTGPGFESRRNDVGVPLPVLGGAWTMLLKAGGAGLDGAGGAGAWVAGSTGSKPGLMHGGTGIRTRGPGTAAGLRFSRPPR